MSNIQSIIVYRNPAEAALWESGLIFPLMVAMFVAFVVALITNSIGERVSKRWVYDSKSGIIVATMSIMSMLATLWMML